MMRTSVTASLDFLATEAGGRAGPAGSGYRSLIRFEGASVDHGFELQLMDGANGHGISPGSTGQGFLFFWAIDELPTLRRGLRFEIREGARVVGYGEILDTG